MKRRGTSILIILCLAGASVSAAHAGTECLSKGHFMLGAGVGRIFDRYLFTVTSGGAAASLEPEFGYFFAGRAAAVTVLYYSAVWNSGSSDGYYHHVQWSGGVEGDLPVHRLFALYGRFTAGIDVEDDGDVNPLFMPAAGGKVFFAPQTPLWFGYRYQGLFERRESGRSDLVSYHGLIFGLQILW
jgi:hypothetical protein